MDRDPHKAFKQLLGMQKTGIEAKIFASLKKNPLGYRGAILALPRESRSLYVHAYQSLIFNQILTK